MKKTLTKFLTLLGVFLLLGAGSANAWTVYYLDYDNWSEVEINYDGTKKTMNWTKDVTVGSSNPKVWKYTYDGTGPANPSKVFFSNKSDSNKKSNTVDFI